MEDNSKDAEVRARVPSDMHSALSKIANLRGEQLPVVVREALTEYLARRAASATTPYPAPGSEALMQILKEQPEVARTLIALGNLLKPNSAPSLADEILSDAIDKVDPKRSGEPAIYRSKPAASRRTKAPRAGGTNKKGN